MSATTRGLISFMYLDNYGTHVNTLPVNVSCKGNVSLEIRLRWQAKEMYAQCFSLFKSTTHKTKISKKFQHQNE